MSDLVTEAKQKDKCSLRQSCKVLSLSRSTYYRNKDKKAVVKSESEIKLEKAIESICEKYPSYGYRRVTKELHRKKIQINHKKVRKIMKANNWLCQKKKKKVRTTDSKHDNPIYPNLIKDLKVDRLNQVWAGDITYIHLPGGFVYLATIIDVYSRRCIGWSLKNSLESELAIDALKMALKNRKDIKNLTHHSDRGVQYTSKDYIKLLNENQIKISMSRKANPYDNAYAESFFKTLKTEEVYMSEYQNKKEAESRIKEFIEEVYNKKRLHSSIGYVPPVEFEKNLTKLKNVA